MKKIIILLSIVFLSCSSNKNSDCNYITDYYPYAAKGELEFFSGNYEEAFKHYQKAFENCDALNFAGHYDTQYFAKICAELGKKDLAMDYIEKSIEKGSTIKTFQSDPIFEKIFKSERGKKIKTNYNDNRAKYLGGINLKLRSKIQKMKEIDQQYNSTKFDDSIYNHNDSILVKIFKKFGYPNEQIIGNYGVDQLPVDPEILLMHSSDSVRINYFIPKMKKFVENGTCPPLILGVLYDNLEYFNGNKLTHGTYKSQSGERRNMISDTAKVNQNRKEIGLPSLSLTDKIDSLKIEYYRK